MRHVVCLCCGAEYPPDGSCPNFDSFTHRVQTAWDVASYLREHGCEHPRPLDVKNALQALDARGRV